MTEKFRMPVKGARIRGRLKCAPPNLDSDEVITEECKKHRADLKPGKKSIAHTTCPRGNECPRGTWLFPRYRVGRDKIKPHRLHLHQGMDLGGGLAKTALKTGAPAPEVVSVVNGHLVELRTKDKGKGFGILVVVQESAPPHRWFLYAHLSEIAPEILAAAGYKKRPSPRPMVYEQQVLGRVGSSGNAGAKEPHLHFEVSLKPLPRRGGMDHETRPGKPQDARINPHRVLRELGPWGAQQLYLPTKKKVTSTTIDEAFTKVKKSTSGGYFPLGANNVWHGGVHLPADAGHVLVAPIDGEIVAVRLDSDPSAVNQAFGSTNFILRRHEIPASTTGRSGAG